MSNDHWCTPRSVDECNYNFFGGRYFDPCSNPGSILRTYKALSAAGLHLPWRRQTYENNPYSKMSIWVDKSARELAAGNCKELVTLWPVATSTAWWKRATGVEPIPPEIKGGKEIRMPNPTIIFSKRIAFLDQDGNPVDGARHDPVLFFYGPEKRHRDFLREYHRFNNWSCRGR